MRIKLLYLYSYNSHNKWMLHTFISFKTEREKEVKPLWEKTKGLLLYSNEKKELQTYRSAPQIYNKPQEMTKEKCPSTQRWEAPLPSFVAPRGIEPLFQGWKPCVLTDRRKGHQSHDRLFTKEHAPTYLCAQPAPLPFSYNLLPSEISLPFGRTLYSS